METLQPKLRFPGFKGNWKIELLDDISVRGSGHTPNKKFENYYNGGIKWISLADSKNLDNGYIEKTMYEISKDGLKKSSAVLHPKETVILSRDAGVGKSAIMKIDMAVSQHFIVWKPIENKLNNWFLYYKLQILKPEFERIAIGNTIKTIGLPYFKKLSFFIPTVKEQTKIANFLSSIDEKINLLKEKKALLEEYKKGMMQKIFNQEIRFAADNGNDFEDWEEKTLGEVSSKESSNISANKIEDNFGEFIIYGASGVLKKVNFYLQENDYISIIKDGAGVGRIFYCEGKSSVLGTMEMIKPIKGINTYFLYCLLNNIDFTKFITGSTIPHIYFKDYSKVICGIPCLKEQTKIANFLSAIDEKITLVATQIEDTQEYKKGLLQQMFV